MPAAGACSRSLAGASSSRAEDRRASSCAGTRAARRAAAAAPPRGSSGTGRPRSRRRTPRRRGRSSRRAGRSPPASASTSGNSSPVSRLIRARRLELRRRDVDADRPRAALREPGGEVRGAAAELDHVEPVDVAEDVQLGLGDRPDAPRDLVERPVVGGALVGVLGVRLGPERGVLRSVVTPAHRGTRARSRARPTRASRSRARGCSASRARTRRGATAGIRVGRVRRADRLAARRDRALALEHERERRARGDEVDELAEERLLAVLGVVRLAELAARDRRAARRGASARGARSARGSRRRGCARRRRAWRG